MTAREAFEFALIELNKVEAPSLLLEDYNYFINKAVYQYINKAYNQYDGNQQKTDDLRVLKATAIVPVGTAEVSPEWGDKIYKVVLPDQYFHMLNVIVNYQVKKAFKCYDAQDNVQFGARRLTADMYGQIINNYYMRPLYKRPYYFINNNPVANINTSVAEGGLSTSGTQKPNPSEVTMELRYGKVNSIFEAKSVLIDYLKAPARIRLSQDQIDDDADTSQILEFPDYVCQEIINELVKLLMENASDPRLQSNIPINQTIAPPPQMQQAPQGRG